MKPVAFFRGGWRKKESKSSPSFTLPTTSTTSSLSSARPSTSSATSILPMQSSSSIIRFPYKSSLKQADARSDIFSSSPGRNVPETAFLRQRTNSEGAIVASGQAPPTPKPRRPPRPPGLDLSSAAPLLKDEDDAGITPRPPFSAPPASGQPKAVLRPPYRRNRSDMELDGVWKGFLAELDEDFDLLDMYSDEIVPENIHRRCFTKHHEAAPISHIPPYTSPFNEASSRTCHPFSRSMSNLPITSSHNKFPNSHGHAPSRNLNAKHVQTAADTLSLFPSPPPLTIRRGKKPPKPLVLLPTPSVASLPPSPSISTPDTTPVATPTTPRFCQSPSNPHRDLPPPASILKKRRTPFISIQTSIDVVASPTASSLRSPSTHAKAPPPRPLRPAQSTSNFHGGNPKHSILHKATSSDPQALDTHALRKYQTILPFPPAHRSHDDDFQVSYLQSQGRTRPRTSLPSANILWGHAV